MLAESLSIPVVASGGLASIDDVKALLAPENRRIAGAITGARSTMAGWTRARLWR